MMCAGITVYSPLKRFGAGPGKKVGIVGIGGLSVCKDDGVGDFPLLENEKLGRTFLTLFNDIRLSKPRPPNGPSGGDTAPSSPAAVSAGPNLRGGAGGFFEL